MKDRIKKIIDNEHITSTQFADKLQIGRAVMSHILNGRNNPSLDVVTKILDNINYINPDWLLTGNGNMFRDGYVSEIEMDEEPNLFNQPIVYPSMREDKQKYRTENAVKTSINKDQTIETKVTESENWQRRKISQIIIYYDDNTFETFDPK